jgi:hypothetical protein
MFTKIRKACAFRIFSVCLPAVLAVKIKLDLNDAASERYVKKVLAAFTIKILAVTG